jgi:pimeloyl-ACP methyl ester carboxylesterase
MQKDIFATPQGEIWLWSEPGALHSQRPVVLFINGAFSIERPRSFDLQALLPGAAVFNAHLPGNHCPDPAAHSVEAYGAAYSAVLDRIGRPAIVIGASVGALAALAIRSATVRGLVLLEPFLQTDHLTLFVGPFREKLRASPQDQGLADFLWSIFGISEASLENRDYRPLLQALATPTRAAFGAELTPVPGGGLPSLVTAAERAAFAAHPQVRTETIEGVGHNLPGRAPGHVRRYAQDLLDAHVLKMARQGDQD